MELTIDQALQQGLAAHKEGKLQDAERLYRAILQAQPKHPDANHNLGLLAVMIGKPLEAIPLFKLALEANPQIEQFWLSYIDTLITVERFDEAKRVVVEGKKSGVSSEKLDALNQRLEGSGANDTNKTVKGQTLSEKRKQLAEKKKSKKRKAQGSSSTTGPSQDQLNHLLGHYQSGRFEEAESLAESLTQHFPKHPFGWKVLGVVLQQTGRLAESLAPMQSAVELSPQDAGAHSNLGVMLKELGRLDEAEASYRKAIALKPDLAGAHSNLGVTLKELGRLDEAEASLRQAITLKSDLAEAHSNLGNTLKELGRLDEAEASCRQAIAMKPDNAEAHYNLGSTLKELGRFDEAEASLRQAIALKPDYVEAHSNLGITLQELGRLDESEASYRQAIALKPDFAEAHTNLGVTLKELDRLDESEASYKNAITVNPNFWKSHFNLGHTYESLGRLAEAETSYRQAIALKQDSSLAHRNLLNCLYAQNKRTQFFDQLRYLISKGETNSVIGSLVCRASLKYGLKLPNPFCNDPLGCVVHTQLIGNHESSAASIAHVTSLVGTGKLTSKPQSLLVNGNQTSGNIFSLGNKYIADIEVMIRMEIEKYRLNFQGSSEGLFTRWPSQYTLKGWLVSMSSGGSLQPHIHENGWLSGSVYINVPQKSMPDSGNLNVAIGEDSDAADIRLNRKEAIGVETGSLVLFPSSLTHYTTPFHSEEDRVVLAFDVERT